MGKTASRKAFLQTLEQKLYNAGKINDNVLMFNKPKSWRKKASGIKP